MIRGRQSENRRGELGFAADTILPKNKKMGTKKVVLGNRQRKMCLVSQRGKLGERYTGTVLRAKQPDRPKRHEQKRFKKTPTWDGLCPSKGAQTLFLHSKNQM